MNVRYFKGLTNTHTTGHYIKNKPLKANLYRWAVHQQMQVTLKRKIALIGVVVIHQMVESSPATLGRVHGADELNRCKIYVHCHFGHRVVICQPH